MNKIIFCWVFVLMLSSSLYYFSFQELLESRILWENKGLGNEGMNRLNAFLHYHSFISIFLVAVIQVILCFSSLRSRYKLIAVSAIPLLFYFIAMWSTLLVNESLGG
jgi:hypothetical protein